LNPGFPICHIRDAGATVKEEISEGSYQGRELDKMLKKEVIV